MGYYLITQTWNKIAHDSKFADEMKKGSFCRITFTGCQFLNTDMKGFMNIYII